MKVFKSSDLADKIAQKLRAARSGEISIKSPYERLGFSGDPFLIDVDLNDPKYLVEREDVFLQFAERLGLAIHAFEEDRDSNFRHLLSHGLLGTGKSSLALHFVKNSKYFGFGDFEVIYTDLDTWKADLEVRNQYDNPSTSLEKFDNFLRNLAPITKPVIIFIDNMDRMVVGGPEIPRAREFFAEVKLHATHGFIVIGFILSMTLSVLQETDEQAQARAFLTFFNPGHFFFPVFSKYEIQELLLQRLNIVKRPVGIFTPNALTLIADYSFGVPRVALNLASDCLNHIIVEGLDRVTSKTVKDVLNNSGYNLATRIVESITREEENELTVLLTSKRREIVSKVLGHQLRERFFFPPTEMDGLRSSDLAEHFGVNLSTMNYHLKPLSKTYPVPLLRTKDDLTDARSKIFYIDWQTHIATALEIIVIYQRLAADKYNIKPETILISQRRDIK